MHESVKAVTRLYLDTVDAALPGFVSGFYYVGSVATGAWEPGRSDIDSFVVTSRPASGNDLAAMAMIHRGIPPDPCFDPVYLDREAFARQPMDREVVPFVVSGEFQTGKRCGELNPVVWLILQKYGVAVRGPDLEIAVDRAALRRFNLDNLREYWQPLAQRVRTLVSGQSDADAVDAADVAWMILGPARLHYTLAREDVIAKSAAAGYLAEEFPEWTELAARAARWRKGVVEAFTMADLRAAASAIEVVADDAWSRWG